MPELIFRETEVYSSYYTKLIAECIKSRFNFAKMMICMSGQDGMTEEFSGFRSFFTMNFIRKPIYNAFYLAAKLHAGLVEYNTENSNIFAVPTKDENGDIAVMLTYCDEYFKEDIPEIEETVTFEDDIVGKNVTVWCIDKNTTNPYRMWQRDGEPKIEDDELKKLREEGKLKPFATFKATDNSVKLNLTANSTYLVTVE